MIYNLLETFKKEYKKSGDKIVIENHKLAEGLYIKIKEDDSFETLIIRKKEEYSGKLFDWFRERDFYSGYISSNKAIKDKKIMSNNYLSLFVKKNELVGKKIKNGIYKDPKTDKKTWLKIINEYYDVLIQKKYNEDWVIKELKYFLDEKDYLYVKKTINNNFDKILDKSIELDFNKDNKENFKNYVKIFFDKKIDSYLIESNRYIYHKTFNKNDYNIPVGEKTFGLSDMNMGLNDKKPFLEHKTTKTKVPYRIELSDAILLYKYSIWLKGQGIGNKYQPYDFGYNMGLPEDNYNNEGQDKIFMRLGNNQGQAEIRDFDIIPAFRHKENIRITNYLELMRSPDKDKNKDKVLLTYPSYTGKLLDSLDKLMYFKRLKTSLRYMDYDNMSKMDNCSKEFKNILITTIDAIDRYINRNDVGGIKSAIDKYFTSLVNENIFFSYYKGQDAFNCYLSVKNYFNMEGDIMIDGIKKNKEYLRLVFKDKEICDFDNINAYSFAAGQVAYLLLSKSNSENKNHDLLEPILNCKNVQKLNDEVKYLFKRYKHEINMNFANFNKVLSMILGYVDKENINEDLLLAGYLSDNIFYEKQNI